MQPRTLDQIISEIRGVYDPQINAVKTKQSLIPQAVQSEEKALGAKQEQAFGSILDGARRRGLGFSGIPVGEQAKYSATEYLPALTRLRQSGQEQAISLEEAIFGINERMQNQALGMRQYEQQRYDQEQARLRAEAEARRQAAAASSANSSWLNSLTGGGGSGGAGGVDSPLRQQAAAGVQEMMNRKGTKSFYEEVQAIAKSAGYGNPVDQAKLELLQATQPGLFRQGALNTTRLNSLLTQASAGPATNAPMPSQGQIYGNTYGGILPWVGNRLKSNYSGITGR